MGQIRVKNLTKRFGSLLAVSDVDMTIEDGEVLCLLGPSGCGKTTTLRMIAGLQQETEGEIHIGNKPVNHLSPSERDIAMVFQFYALYPTLTVAENIAFPLRSVGMSREEIASLVDAVMTALQLHEVANRTPGQLGEGEKQRVAVARAVVRDPNCFLFDEPLSRLDITLRETMRGEIKEILTGLSKATVIVTHDQLEALTMADRIAVMRGGRVEQIATPHEIFSRPANLFVAGFIGTPSMNLLPATFTAQADDETNFQAFGQNFRSDAGKLIRDYSPGSKVTLGIRPRAFQLRSEGSKEGLSVEIDLIEPMGAETLLHARTDNTNLRVVVDRSQKVKVGERLNIVPKPDQTLVFGQNEQLVMS
ncbi:Trehalose import ATP-binding protein SugC [Roseibium album]|nr:Trehalose import ATP-binding protein SugC [Roseibium album]